MDSTPPPARLEVGARLDRYELLHPLAEGGMATVWLARMHGKRGFRKLVVLKTIKAQYSEDERFQEMFLDEARIASGIQHPNVAQIIDLGETNETLYLSMEWVDGESLARIRRELQKKQVKLPIGVTLRIVADLCAGLHAAHELKDEQGHDLGVVHRDVSPHNIMIATTGAVKVIDFGIAKAKGRASAETNAGFLKGKISYMAPEQAAGDPIDRRTDVWAVGVVLYELLTGKLPYEGDGQAETLKLIVSGRPPLLRPEIPGPVRDLVKRALAHNREQRFQTTLELQRALETAMGSLNLATSSAEIGAFLEQHLEARTKARQKMVATALESSRLRAEAAGEPSSVPSAAGAAHFTTSPHVVRVEPTSVPTLGAPPSNPAIAQPPPSKRGGMNLAIVGVAAVVLGGGALVIRSVTAKPQPATTPAAEKTEPRIEAAAPKPSATPAPSPEPAAPVEDLPAPSAVAEPKPSTKPPSGYALPKKPGAPPTASVTIAKPPKPKADDDDF